MIVSSSLGVFFIFLILTLAAQRFLLPGIIIIGSFVLFVLWLTGLIETSLQLYGVVANINDNCQIYVVHNVSRGNNLGTLAWLVQSAICTPPPHSICLFLLLFEAVANEQQATAGKRHLRSSLSIRCFSSG